MRIGEFAKRAGVSASKIRFYEGRGLLPYAARSANGYRCYDAADLRIVTFIDRVHALGFSLSDIARFMSRPAQARRDKTGLVDVLERKVTEIDAHISEVHARRAGLMELLSELKRGAHGEAAR